MERTAPIVVIGAGFSGLCAAIRLKQAGFENFTVLEQADDLGGTWRDNTYPGAACDVPSHLYSYSFAPNHRWRRWFAGQSEIHGYLRRTAEEYGIVGHIRFGCRVNGVRYRDDQGRWEITTDAGEKSYALAVVACAGALSVPSSPDITGRDAFAGNVFHSSNWDHSIDLDGKSVAIVGTGASTVQFLPPVVRRAAEVTVFQRTPTWVLPKPERTIPPALGQVFGRLPWLQRVVRTAVFVEREVQAAGFALTPLADRWRARRARKHLAARIADHDLRAKLTPDHTVGCNRRIPLSNDYYPALASPNVTLVTESPAEVRERSVVCGDGREYPADVIIFGTGFRPGAAIAAMNITGRGGITLASSWDRGPEAHLGMMIPRFPNLFLIFGPNAGLQHNSIVFMIERQISYVIECLSLLDGESPAALEVRPSAMAASLSKMRARRRRSAWAGCETRFLDPEGVNRTLWPGFAFEYWLATRRVRRADFELVESESIVHS
ncbi:NAD(P)/FAD-dependent oxidoreductase [Nocardia sp. NPDC051030]|uniref:flavin-containing monooxygenase n=1 Tax=Nocardia sp. NPDC051030 TaxID=3155162 RepID=UPI003412DC06